MTVIFSNIAEKYYIYSFFFSLMPYSRQYLHAFFVDFPYLAHFKQHQQLLLILGFAERMKSFQVKSKVLAVRHLYWIQGQVQRGFFFVFLF